MRLGVGLAACLVVGACAEGDEAQQTTSQVLGGGDDDSDSTTGGPGMTSMASNTWTPATEGGQGTASGDSDDQNADSSSEGANPGPADPYEPCQGQQAPVGPVERWAPATSNALALDLIGPPSAGGTLACDPFTQDCPDGEKCMPWADDGGASWNATRCTPIDPNPQQLGDACMVEGSGVSGIDNCDIGLMCFDVDAETNEGTCTEMCSGTAANPVCESPDATCIVSNNDSLVLCVPICNPLANECGPGEGCYFASDTSVCAPDASGDMGAAGDPCEFVNVCDDGLFCGNPSLVDGCDSIGCCTSFCAVGDDSMCAPGQSCLEFFPDGSAPAACLEGLGACSV